MKVGHFVQPGLDAIGIVTISHGCTGVVARACSLVGIDPSKVNISPFPAISVFIAG